MLSLSTEQFKRTGSKVHSSPRGSGEVMKPLRAHRCLREASCLIPLRSCRIMDSSSSAAAIQQVTSSIAFFSTSLFRALKQDRGKEAECEKKLFTDGALCLAVGMQKHHFPTFTQLSRLHRVISVFLQTDHSTLEQRQRGIQTNRLSHFYKM